MKTSGRRRSPDRKRASATGPGRLPATDPPRDRRQKKWVEKCTGEVLASNPDLAPLRHKLLSRGGWGTILPRIEEDLEPLMKRGRFSAGQRIRTLKGAPSRCHANSSRLWEENRSVLRLYTGYALSSDGLWRQHSWCRAAEGRTIIETTEPRLCYFGFMMTSEQAEEFARANA